MKKVKRKILLNPGPATTTDTVKDAQVIPDICHREKEFGNLMQEIRKDLVKIAGGDENYTAILFGGSGTAAMEAAISSVTPPKKKILIINNGLYGERFVKIAEIHNIDVVELTFEWGEKIDTDKVKAAFEKNNDIAAVALIHHETTTGILNQIKEICTLAKDKNCTTIVDTISSFAGVPFSIKDCNIDFMMSTSNKCIQGMPGVSFIICKKNELEKIKDYPKRSYYLDLYAQYEFLEKRKQARFTVPIQTMYALRQAIKEFFEEGAENRYERYRKNNETLVKGLKELGFTFFLKDDAEPSGLLTTINYPNDPNFDFDTLHDKLYDRGFTIYPGRLLDGNTFRIANIGAIDHHDIQNFLEALKEVLDEMRIEVTC